MKKNELKSGMIVKYRDGSKRLVVGDNLIGDDYYTSLPNFNDDLKHTLLRELDIIKVYNNHSASNFSGLLEDDNLDLIWERKDIKLTDREIEILKALKLLGFNFLARDDSPYLHAYTDKPDKYSYYWESDYGDDVYIDNNNNIFDFIKWEDKEPTNIDELLKGGK